MRKIYLLLLSLILLPYMAVAQNNTGVFTVTGGTLGKDYIYTAPPEYETNGDDVLTIKTNTQLTISTKSGSGTAGGCRIVIENDVTANITLAGANITPATVETDDGPSGIDLGSMTTLNITLQDGTVNKIYGGISITGLPGPGIHVPENATLKIMGNGSLEVNGASCNSSGAVGIGGKRSDSEAGEGCGNVIILGGTIEVHGGSASASRPPVDIGGGNSDTQKGGDCNTVIILTPVNSGGGLTIGGGKGLSSNDGSDGQGIRPSGDGSYTVWGNLTVPDDITLPEGIILAGDGTISPETARPKPTITFTDEDLEKTYDGQSASLNSNDYTYTGGGTISFAWYSDNNGTQGDKLDNAPSDAGTYWVGVSAEATNLYQAAEEATKQFTIKPATATSPETPTLEAVTYGVKLSKITLPDGWTWADDETVPTVTNTGYTAYYTVTDYTNYDWSAVEGWNETEYRVERTVELTVKKANPTPDETPTVYTATYGDKLSDITLPEGWAWEDKTQLVGNVGEQKFTAIFTPEDTKNYNTVETKVTITVKQADISEQIKAEDGQTVISLDLETGSTILTAYVEGERIPGDGVWAWEYDKSMVAIEEIPETQSIVSKSSRKVTPVSVGITTITATYATDNYTGSISYTLTVTEPEPEEPETPDTPVTPDYPDYRLSRLL